MGWFSSDEIVTPVVNNSEVNGHQTAQTVALCALAGIITGYVLFREISKLICQNTEKLAETAARRVAAQV